MKTRFTLSDDWPTVLDKFYVELGGQSGSAMTFNDIASMFTGREI